MISSVVSNPQNSPGWYKRLFAWMMHQFSTVDASTIKLKHCSCALTFAELKRSLLAQLHGEVLEIGPGTGSNLSYYPTTIHWIGLEPNSFMFPYLRKEAERLNLDIDLRSGTAERMDIEDNSLDAVVSTLVLCSVDNLAVTLLEVLRVLKPGGRFLFLEHVAAPQGTWLRRVQQGIQPFWKALGDGCHPDRETWVAIEEAGFESVSYEHFQVPTIAIASPCIAGVAIKKANEKT